MARILIVDDEELDRRLGQLILERAGHSTFFASNGEEALDVYRFARIDVVITDLQMPGMHGLELITVLRDLVPRPVIIATSCTGQAQLDIARAIGADATLTKPVDPGKLLTTVAMAVTDEDGELEVG